MFPLVSSLCEVCTYQGLPVSKETAEKTFCALRGDWWKQVFDGKYHVHGKMVFDEGLHGREKEPGFYESALKAFHFAKENMGTKFTVDFYCQLHQTACSHFQGKLNNTEMHSSKAGIFRDKSSFGVRAGFPMRNAYVF